MFKTEHVSSNNYFSASGYKLMTLSDKLSDLVTPLTTQTPAFKLTFLLKSYFIFISRPEEGIIALGAILKVVIREMNRSSNFLIINIFD